MKKAPPVSRGAKMRGMTTAQWLFAAGMALKGVAAVGFLYVAKLIAPHVMRLVPEGRIRRLLLVRLNKSGS